MHCSITAVTHLTSLGEIMHKRPLLQPLEHCRVSWRLEKVQQWRHCSLGVTVCCVSMALKWLTFLQCSKVLFPAHGPVFSSPVRAPHNWGLCSLWSSELCSIYARHEHCCCCMWDMNLLVLSPQLHWRPGLIHCLSCAHALYQRSVWRVSLFWMWHLLCGVVF